jgi:hypothetical protein
LILAKNELINKLKTKKSIVVIRVSNYCFELISIMDLKSIILENVQTDQNQFYSYGINLTKHTLGVCLVLRQCKLILNELILVKSELNVK